MGLQSMVYSWMGNLMVDKIKAASIDFTSGQVPWNLMKFVSVHPAFSPHLRVKKHRRVKQDVHDPMVGPLDSITDLDQRGDHHDGGSDVPVSQQLYGEFQTEKSNICSRIKIHRLQTLPWCVPLGFRTFHTLQYRLRVCLVAHVESPVGRYHDVIRHDENEEKRHFDQEHAVDLQDNRGKGRPQSGPSEDATHPAFHEGLAYMSEFVTHRCPWTLGHHTFGQSSKKKKRIVVTCDQNMLVVQSATTERTQELSLVFM